jgi:hypothetical protein
VIQGRESAGSARRAVRLLVAAASCTGTLTLEGISAGKASVAAHKKSAKLIVLGKAKFSVPAHQKKTIKVKLGAAGKRILKHAHKLKGYVLTTFKGPNGKQTTVRQPVTIKRR